MKNVSESTWSFQIILIFIFIFACFLTLVLTYSKAYTIKNRMLTIIEKYNGITTDSSEYISNFVSEHSYTGSGKCPEGWYGVKDIYEDVQDFELASDKERYNYCYTIKDANRKSSSDPVGWDPSIQGKNVYYEIVVFYKFNLPFIGEIATYKIKGQTHDFKASNSIIVPE